MSPVSNEQPPRQRRVEPRHVALPSRTNDRRLRSNPSEAVLGMNQAQHHSSSFRPRSVGLSSTSQSTQSDLLRPNGAYLKTVAKCLCSVSLPSVFASSRMSSPSVSRCQHVLTLYPCAKHMPNSCQACIHTLAECLVRLHCRQASF